MFIGLLHLSQFSHNLLPCSKNRNRISMSGKGIHIKVFQVFPLHAKFPQVFLRFSSMETSFVLEKF
jgi:hypothetical protein